MISVKWARQLLPVPGMLALGFVVAQAATHPSRLSSGPLPDLALTPAGVVVGSPPWVGAPTQIAARITNAGDAVAEPVTVQFTVDDGPVGRVTLPSLAAGTTTEALVIWAPHGRGGSHAVGVVVDPDNSVPESDETNNSAERSVFVAPGPYALFLPLVTKGAQPGQAPLVLVADETDADAAAPLVQALTEQGVSIVRAAQFPAYRTYPSIAVVAGPASDPAEWALAAELLNPEEREQVLSTDTPLAFMETDRYAEGQHITVYTGRTRELVRRAVQGAAPAPARPTPVPMRGAPGPTPIPLPTPTVASAPPAAIPLQDDEIPQQCLDAMNACLEAGNDPEDCYDKVVECAVDGLLSNLGLPTWFPVSCWITAGRQVGNGQLERKEWLNVALDCLRGAFCQLGGVACSVADLILAFAPRPSNAGLVFIFTNSGDPLPPGVVVMRRIDGNGDVLGEMTGDHNPWAFEYSLWPPEPPFWYHFEGVIASRGSGRVKFFPDPRPVQFVVVRFIEEKPCPYDPLHLCTYIYLLHIILERYTVDYSVQPVRVYYDDPNRPPTEIRLGAEVFYPAPDYGQPAIVTQFPGQDCVEWREPGDRRYVLDSYQLDGGPRMPVNACRDPNRIRSDPFPVRIDAPYLLTFNYRRTYADPAVVPGSLTITPSPAQQGQMVRAQAVVKNVGERPAENLEVAIRVDGQTVATSQFLYIAPGEEKYPLADWNSRGAAPGPHLVEVIVDPADAIAEGPMGEGNNRAFATVMLTAPTLPDLTFTDRVHDVGYVGPPNPRVGDVLTLSARVSNLTPVGANDVVVEFRDGELTIIGRDTIPGIVGMGAGVARLVWDTTGTSAGQHCILATIDPDDTIRELQEGWDNSAATCLDLLPGPTPTPTPTVTPTPPGIATLLIRASDFTNPINGVQVSASPPDRNGISQGATPFTLSYSISDTVTLQVLNLDSFCSITIAGVVYAFSNWRADQDAVIRQPARGPCRQIIDLDISGPNSIVTALFERVGPITPTATPTPTPTATRTPTRTPTATPTVATLLIRAADLSGNPISGVPVSVFPPDRNGAGDGITPFTRFYDIGQRITLRVMNLSNCLITIEGIAYRFSSWRADRDAQIVEPRRGVCEGEVIDIDITGPNPILTARFQRVGTPTPTQTPTRTPTATPRPTIVVTPEAR